MPKLEQQVKAWLEGKRDFKNLSIAQKNDGFSDEQIAKYSKLSPAEIENL